jgi:hypothetical protein
LFGNPAAQSLAEGSFRKTEIHDFNSPVGLFLFLRCAMKFPKPIEVPAVFHYNGNDKFISLAIP